MNVVRVVQTASVVGGAVGKSLLVGFDWLVWKHETRRGKALKSKKKNNKVTGEEVERE
jgi:hypothetical protein